MPKVVLDIVQFFLMEIQAYRFWGGSGSLLLHCMLWNNSDIIEYLPMNIRCAISLPPNKSKGRSTKTNWWICFGYHLWLMVHATLRTYSELIKLWENFSIAAIFSNFFQYLFVIHVLCILWEKQKPWVFFQLKATFCFTTVGIIPFDHIYWEILGNNVTDPKFCVCLLIL